MGWTDIAGGFALGGPIGAAAGALDPNLMGDIKGGLKDIGLGGASSSDEQKMNNLNGVGAGAMGFAGQAQGDYNNLTGQGQRALSGLSDIANGQRSVSAEQLRQGLQQNLASQQAAAASAAPGNSAMAARNAAMNMNRAAYGLSGQQAVAGLAERNQAQGQDANLLGQMRGQDVQGAVGGYNAASGAYGGGLNGQRDPTIAQQWAPIVQGVAKGLA